MTRYIQVDDFARDLEQVREAVISCGFSTVTGPDGAEYTNVSSYQAFHWYGHIERELGRKIDVKLSGFRLNLAGELPHSWVHADSICAKYATVLYMNDEEQCDGGTAFWRHKKLGLESLPAGESEEFYRAMERDWKDIDLWERVDFVAMKPNRFITYPTSLFHSRFPFEGFGSGPRDGRLVWVCFYD